MLADAGFNLWRVGRRVVGRDLLYNLTCDVFWGVIYCTTSPGCGGWRELLHNLTCDVFWGVSYCTTSPGACCGAWAIAQPHLGRVLGRDLLYNLTCGVVGGV